MTRLQQLRVDAGLTVQQLAEKADVPAGVIYRLEAGKGTSVARLSRIGEALEVRPSELLRAAVFPEERAA